MSLQPTQASFLSAAPVKWCLLSWWQYVSLALHVLWLHRCLPRSLLPSLSPSQPTHILSFPSHASKSIAETNVKWLQKRKLLAASLQLRKRADKIAVWRGVGQGSGGGGGVGRGWWGEGGGGRRLGWWGCWDRVSSKFSTVSLLRQL